MNVVKNQKKKIPKHKYCAFDKQSLKRQHIAIITNKIRKLYISTINSRTVLCYIHLLCANSLDSQGENGSFDLFFTKKRNKKLF